MAGMRRSEVSAARWADVADVADSRRRATGAGHRRPPDDPGPLQAGAMPAGGPRHAAECGSKATARASGASSGWPPNPGLGWVNGTSPYRTLRRPPRTCRPQRRSVVGRSRFARGRRRPGRPRSARPSAGGHCRRGTERRAWPWSWLFAPALGTRGRGTGHGRTSGESLSLLMFHRARPGECAGSEDRRLSGRLGRLPSRRGSPPLRTAPAVATPHRPRRWSLAGTPGRRRHRSGTVRGAVRWSRAIDAQASLVSSAATALPGVVPRRREA